MVGGGPIGTEMAQAYRRFGARVTVLDLGPLLPRDDPQMVHLLSEQLSSEGVALRPHVAIASAAREDGALTIRLSDGERIAGSHILVAAGRRPSIEALDLPAAGIAANPRGIVVDARLRTTNRKAFAVGDVVGGPQFTHAALYQAGVVILKCAVPIAGESRLPGAPGGFYTDTELAQAGLTEGAARQQFGDRIRVVSWPFADNDRAQTERDITGLTKIVAQRSGRILAPLILGAGAVILSCPVR